MAEEEDDKQNRKIWRIEECPVDGCRKDRFKNAKCWSTKGPDACRSYLKRHLMKSTQDKHSLESEEADIMMIDVEVVEDTDTFADRQSCRKSSEEHKKRKWNDEQQEWQKQQKRDENQQWHTQQGNVGELQQQVYQLSQTVQQLSSAAGGSFGGNASSASVITSNTLAEVGAPVQIEVGASSMGNMVQIPVARLCLVRDTVRRAQAATNDAMLALVGPLRRLQAEKMVFDEASEVLDKLIIENS